MVTSYCGQYFLTVFNLLMVFEGIISLELLELRVPTHVVLGTRAQLSCRWTLGPVEVLYSVKWYKDGKEFFRHVPRDSEPTRNFPLPGVQVEESDSSGSRLLLSAVVFDTAGRYRCEISGEKPLFPTVSKHADMEVVVLPQQGPFISGLKARYYPGEHVRLNCTSDLSRPPCQLTWYINNEPAPPKSVLPPMHQVYADDLETTTLILDFRLTDQHFIKDRLKVKCLATIASLYWRSTEASALQQKLKPHEKILLNAQKSSSTGDRIHWRIASLFLAVLLQVFGEPSIYLRNT